MALFSLSSLIGSLGHCAKNMTPLVSSVLLNYQPNRGLKYKEVLRLRCKDCYFKKVDEQWMVLCKSFGKHKQAEKIDDVKRKWIVTHVTRTGRPFQKKEESYILNTCPPGPFDYRIKLGQKMRIRRKWLA